MATAQTDNEDQSLTDFGASNIPKAEKNARVREVFSSVASKYDVMNDLMSLGVHRLWKRHFVRLMQPRLDQHLLDVAGGTGDIARLFLKNGGGQVTLCDLTPEMLEEGRARSLDQGFHQDMQWVCGRAEALPFAERTFHAYSISFGLRNVADRERALHEAYRVLRPGGHFYCLEFSPQVLPVLQRLYDVYSDNLLPRLGEWIAGDAESYIYLVESIRRFRDPVALAKDLEQVGFQRVSHTPLSAGIVSVHQGFKV